MTDTPTVAPPTEGEAASGGHVARLLAIRSLLAECEGAYPSDDEKIAEAHDLVSGLAAALREAAPTPAPEAVADPSVDEETAEHLTVCGIVLRDCTAGELGLTPGSRK